MSGRRVTDRITTNYAQILKHMEVKGSPERIEPLYHTLVARNEASASVAFARRRDPVPEIKIHDSSIWFGVPPHDASVVDVATDGRNVWRKDGNEWEG